MKNKSLNIILLALLMGIGLSACAPARLNTQPAVHALSSKQVSFGPINTKKKARGLVVTGTVRKNSRVGKHITIPGHIHVLLKNKNGRVLETVKARTHRRYGNSSVWHFDAVLKRHPAVGSRVVVKYHGRHF